MAKVIKYKFLSCEINHGTEESPDIEQLFLDKSMIWSEANEEIAKREAYNGVYTVEDVPDPVPAASRNITVGEYFAVDGVLYKATDNIPNGEPIITGQNAIETTVEEQLAELTRGA